jgi:hypothetical protein
MRYFVELYPTHARYNGLLYADNAAARHPLGTVRLSPTDAIVLRGQTYSFATLLQTLITSEPKQLAALFDLRSQLELGQQLYAQTLGQLPENERQRLHAAGAVELRIVTNDEELARLPWHLLAQDGHFLSAMDWSVALAQGRETVDCELPPSPRLLVVAPRPYNSPATLTEQHLEALEEMLSTHDPLLTWGRHLRLVERWEEFVQQLAEFEPQLVYYYGHGKGDAAQSELIFTSGVERQLHKVAVADFALHLRRSASPPALVYVNCCQGTPAATWA